MFISKVIKRVMGGIRVVAQCLVYAAIAAAALIVLLFILCLILFH